MSKHYLVTAVIVAVVVMCAPIVGIFSNNADATTSAHGTYSVYAYDGTTWSTDLVTDAYDAAQAVKNSDLWDSSTDSMTPLYVDGTYVTYQPEVYGNITTFMGLTNSTENEWNVFVKVGSNWVSPSPSLGCYVCFDDVSANYQTANICLYYGSAGAAVPTDIPTSTQATSEITQVTQTSLYEYRFYLQVSSDYEVTVSEDVQDEDGNVIDADALHDGVFVKGYGSNAAIAINAVLGNNISIVTDIPGINNGSYYTYQGWINSLYGLTTQQTAGADTPTDWTDDTYAYWCLYDTYEAFDGETNNQADFVLGAYSTMSCAPIADSTLSLIYGEVDME